MENHVTETLTTAISCDFDELNAAITAQADLIEQRTSREDILSQAKLASALWAICEARFTGQTPDGDERKFGERGMSAMMELT